MTKIKGSDHIKHSIRKNFKILSIDGGGMRGVYPAHILKCIQERFAVSLYEEFDLIAGTSTGSILAAAVATKTDISEVLSLYETQGKEIFKKKLLWEIPYISSLPKFARLLFQSQYKNNLLYSVLNSTLGDLRLGDISKPLIIPSSDIGNGNVHIFKSYYCDKYKRDRVVRLADAVLASCSAPLYFDPARVNEYLLADGGIWCNNPALVCVLEAQKRLRVDLKDIRLLSIGTGQSKKGYSINSGKHWGVLGWKGTNLIDYIMSLQSQAIDNYLGFLLAKEQYIRINFEYENSLPLDEYSNIEDLISKADKSASYKTEELAKIFSE